LYTHSRRKHSFAGYRVIAQKKRRNARFTETGSATFIYMLCFVFGAEISRKKMDKIQYFRVSPLFFSRFSPAGARANTSSRHTLFRPRFWRIKSHNHTEKRFVVVGPTSSPREGYKTGFRAKKLKRERERCISAHCKERKKEKEAAVRERDT